MAAVENERLGVKLIRCFHDSDDEGDSANYLKHVRNVALERGFTQVDKLEVELNAPEEEQGVMRDLFDIYLLFTFLGQTPWTSIMVLATTILDVCGNNVSKVVW
jgi:hypothetical protein